jgi:hypothetical protein
VEYIDKEIRKGKGRWEQKILEALNRFGGAQFKKRTFMAKKEIYELDAACPASGDIEIGIDVKRIEAKRDIRLGATASALKLTSTIARWQSSASFARGGVIVLPCRYTIRLSTGIGRRHDAQKARNLMPSATRLP